MESTPFLPPGELQRSAGGDLEPIQFPGAVQPHGALLAVDEESGWIITHVSANTREVLGADPLALVGRPLTDLVDGELLSELEAVLGDTDAGNPAMTTIDGKPFDVLVHRTNTELIVEFEPYEETPSQTILGIRTALRRLGSARTVRELWEVAARRMKRITGFDRVMVYHFHPDGHGEIVAEAVEDDMEPYIGLHFPASDIPAQAGIVSVTKMSQMIVNSGRSGVALLADANRSATAPLDLECAELSAVSSRHLEFMRNMGQVSTFSLSLIRNGVLVGMINCANRMERRLPYNLRDALELLANQVSLQLAAMRDAEQLAERNDTRELRAAIVAQAARTDDLMDALLRQQVTLLDFIPADGAAVRLGQSLESVGTVPEATALNALVSLLQNAEAPADLVTDSLEAEYPSIAAAMPGVAGLLMRPLGSEGDFIAWFRGAGTRTVEWLGDMSLENSDSPSPRTSFSAWSQEVAGVAAHWDGKEREALELGRDLQATLLRRAESQLAELALYDSLTSLPNRRLLEDRLEQALSRRRGTGVALLFVDLDDFKEINDTFGHSEGDAALIQIANVLRSAARSEDTVARLGGDEFVVLCRDITTDDARELAQRLLDAIHRESDRGGESPWRLEASIGVAVARSGTDASELLTAADAAMYRAKTAGKGRLSV